QIASVFVKTYAAPCCLLPSTVTPYAPTSAVSPSIATDQPKKSVCAPSAMTTRWPPLGAVKSANGDLVDSPAPCTIDGNGCAADAGCVSRAASAPSARRDSETESIGRNESPRHMAPALFVEGGRPPQCGTQCSKSGGGLQRQLGDFRRVQRPECALGK